MFGHKRHLGDGEWQGHRAELALVPFLEEAGPPRGRLDSYRVATHRESGLGVVTFVIFADTPPTPTWKQT